MLRIHGDRSSLIAALTKEWHHQGSEAGSATLADLMSHWAESKLDLPHSGSSASTSGS